MGNALDLSGFRVYTNILGFTASGLFCWRSQVCYRS